MAADGSYTYDPHSIPDLENLSLGTHTRHLQLHGDGRPRRRIGRLDADDHGTT